MKIKKLVKNEDVKLAKRLEECNKLMLALKRECEEYQVLMETKNQMERYIEINRGFASLRIQFDFNPMNIF